MLMGWAFDRQEENQQELDVCERMWQMIKYFDVNLHVFLSNNTESRENFDNLCHHVGLFGVNRSCQQQQAPLISQDPLQSILWDMGERR